MEDLPSKLDVDDQELLRFLGNLIPSSPIATTRFVVPELQKLVALLIERPGYTVEDISHGGHEVMLRRERHRSTQEAKRMKPMERRETCKVFFHRFWPREKAWTIEDSQAFFVSITSAVTELEQTPHFTIVVVPSKVTPRARNDGFSAHARRRVLPLSTSEIDAFDMSIQSRRHAPKCADVEVVADALNCQVAELADLPLLSIDDPAVLWDLDVCVGSYVHCPPSQTGFRIVASVLED